MNPKNDFDKAFVDVQKFEKIGENLWRASENHIKGEIFYDRVYGGQLVAQSYLVAKNLLPQKILSKIETNFIGPGTAINSLDYHTQIQNNDIANIMATQNEKYIAKSVLRFVDTPQNLLKSFHIEEDCFQFIKLAKFYPEMGEIFKSSDIKNYTKEHQEFFKSICGIKLFEVRPVNSKNFVGLNGEVLYNWCRLVPEIRELEINDPIFILLFLSDWLINEPAILFYDNLIPNLYKFYSSINHKIWIHAHDFDPKNYFLYAVKCEAIAKRHTLVKGHIYDEHKRCLATMVQESFIEEND